MGNSLGITGKIAQSTLSDLGVILSVQSVSLSQGVNLANYPLVQSHRREYYEVGAPHLLDASELNNEYSIDQRSEILYISLAHQVLASLRLTPRPFEIEGFELHDVDFARYEGYLEIGRLVTNPQLDQLTSALIVRYLLCMAGLRAFGDMGCKGFVAICRPHRASFFAKFGLQELGHVFSEQRGIVYRFLAGSVTEILSATAQLQENEEALKKRLVKTFGVQNA